MTLSATDWDASNGEVEHVPSDQLTLVKGRLNHPAPATFSSAVPTVPDHEVDDLSWLERQFTMQSRDDHEANRSVWTQGNSPWMTGSSDGLVIVSPNVNPVPNDSTLDAIINEAVHAVDVPLRHITYQDDELLSWLQYPPDYPLDRGSDWLGDFPNSVKVGKHSLDGLSSKPQETSLTSPGTGFRGVVPPSPGVSGLSIRSTISQNREPTGSSGGDSPEEKNEVAGADAAAAAGWVADPSCQSGAEVFNEVRDTVMQPPLGRCLHTAASNANMKKLAVSSLVRKPPHGSSSQRQNPLRLDPVAFFTPPPPPRRPGARNFSLFSRPVAETKASLHMVGAGSGPTNIERVRKQYGKSARVELNANESSLGETITTVSDKGSNVAQIQVGEAIQYYETLEIRQITPSSSCGQQSDKERGKGICRDSNLNSSVCFSAVTASEKGVEILEAADQTATSPSRGSGNSTDKSGKEAATTFNRKFSAGDDSEYQSEDVEEDANNNKKPTSGIKRSRAAEIHNQSERRRRDRINEKMKALQDLIPNANKTDKVSMLDEVIEYMKLLQSQLQTMSMRTGIGIPPTMIPSMGMQHLQMPPLPHVGMGMGMGVGLGMGMGMGMGMGLMDVNAAAGRMMMPMQPLHCQLPVGAPSHVAGLQVCTPPLSMAETHDHLQNSSIMDHYNPYLAHQQIQPASLNLNMHRNMELYNAYMQQQHHHHQQQWQQRMQ